MKVLKFRGLQIIILTAEKHDYPGSKHQSWGGGGGGGGQGIGWGFDCLCCPWGRRFDLSCSPGGGDI